VLTRRMLGHGIAEGECTADVIFVENSDDVDHDMNAPLGEGLGLDVADTV